MLSRGRLEIPASVGKAQEGVSSRRSPTVGQLYPAFGSGRDNLSRASQRYVRFVVSTRRVLGPRKALRAMFFEPMRRPGWRRSGPYEAPGPPLLPDLERAAA